jgi:hypothetical protein
MPFNTVDATRRPDVVPGAPPLLDLLRRVDAEDPKPVIPLRPALHKAIGAHRDPQHEHERIALRARRPLRGDAVLGLAEQYAGGAGDLHVVALPSTIVPVLDVAIA